MEDSSLRPIKGGRKSGSRRNLKGCRPKYDVAMPFARKITDATGTSSQNRRKGDKPVGYSGRAGLRRE
jgi:hypothetical protein